MYVTIKNNITWTYLVYSGIHPLLEVHWVVGPAQMGQDLKVLILQQMKVKGIYRHHA